MDYAIAMSERAPVLERSERTLPDSLLEPVDIASLVFFRIAFGLVMAWEVIRYFAYDWIHQHFIAPKIHFHYYGLGWIQPLPGAGMYVVFALIGAAAILIALGLFYRTAAAAHLVLFAYMFLSEQTRYLNHFYLVLLVNLLLCFIPAHRAFSLDAWRNPSLRSDTAPGWCVWALRLQIAVVYFYGGVHKLNYDWLNGEPMRTFLLARVNNFPLIGQWFDRAWMVAVFVFGGIALDLFIVPALLWKPTRIPALIAVILFHLTNSQLFTIGIFPWFMICATLLFLPPSWPRALVRAVTRHSRDMAGGGHHTAQPTGRSWKSLGGRQRLAVAAFCAYAAVQLLIPIKPYLYPGNQLWAEESMWFSWNMMLASKEGAILFTVRDPATERTWKVDPDDYITEFQHLFMVRSPDIILQFAHFLRDKWEQDGYADVEVFGYSLISMNGRQPQVYVDPKVDLAKEKRGFAHKTWIVPLKEPVPPKIPWDAQTAVNTEHFQY